MKGAIAEGKIAIPFAHSFFILLNSLSLENVKCIDTTWSGSASPLLLK